MITADQYTVAAVLGDNFVHQVPPYQRPYAWQKTEALQLLDDLEQAVAADPHEPYFLGSIVLIKPSGEKTGQVVDGQQRLTTLTILAAVLRDLATNTQEAAALANAVYIEPNTFLGQTEALRVHAHFEDAGFFREAIQIPGATAKQHPPQPAKNEAQGNMWANAMALRARLSALPEAARQMLVSFLLNKCVLVIVSTESRAAALRIFSVLNDRGVDLSNADVIKADVLAKFGDPSQQTHYATRWRAFETELGRDNFEGLLEYLRFIRERTKNRKTLSEAYGSFLKGISPDQVKSFFDDELRPAANWLAVILDGTVEQFPEELRAAATEALAGLRLLPNRDWIPTALAAALHFGPTAATVQTFEALEGLAWAMQLGRRYDTERMSRYAEVIGALKTGQASLAAALLPTKEEKAEAWEALNGSLYERFPVRVVRAILERLDRLMSEQPIVWNGQITVEHILPQTPAVGDWEEFSAEERASKTHTLGNLVLLTKRKNSSASNYTFEEKRNVYFGLRDDTGKRATYASVQELGLLHDWTPVALDARHSRQSKLLGNRWCIHP